jgi:4-amino-4-deoxy-L-arabinose transferase-like glycosyltransferase
MIRGYAGRIWLITLAGLAARVALLGYQPLWRDEAFTALAVQRSLGSMLTVVRHDSAPPLFYLIERLVAVVSTSPAALRIFPVLAGVATIPIIAALGRRVAGDSGGTWAAVIAAVAPALFVSSLDARMYMLAMLLVLASTLCLLRALERPSTLRWALYAGVSILAVYTVYFALFAVLAQVIAVAILYGRRTPRTALLVGGLGALTLLSLTPWVVVASSQLSHGAGGFWVPKLSVVSLSGGLVQFFIGPPLSTWVTGYVALRIIEGASVAAGVVGLAAVVLNRRRLHRDEAHAASMLGLVGGIAVAMVIVVSIWHPLEDGRYFSTAWAALFPLAGAGLALIPWRQARFAAAAATAVVAFATVTTVTNPDTPAAVAALEKAAGTRDVIAAYPSEYLLVLYYGDHAIDVHTRSMASVVPWFWGTAVYPSGAVLQAMPTPSSTAPRVWYVFEPGDPPPPDPDGYAARSTRCWTGVCVTMLTPSGIGASGANST